MAINLVKRILSVRYRPCNDICCTVRQTCENYSLAPDLFPKLISKRCLGSKAKTETQEEETFHKDGKFPISFVQGNDMRKHTTGTADNSNVITPNDIALIKMTETDVLEPCKEDVSDIAPFAMPAFNLAAYVNTSYTLQQFVLMGVQLHLVERKQRAAESILKLDFEKHVKPHLRFLHDVGVPAEEFGSFVTKNPLIFEQNLDDLQIRVNYLEAKRFTTDGISRIVTRNPLWLNFSTIEIDKRLGFFQRSFILSGDEVRTLAVKRPRLITYDLEKVTVSLFAVKEEMGFSEAETKTLLLKAPKLFVDQTKSLKSRFDYVHNIMGISHEHILQQPGVLTFREFIVKHRHEFLKELGKDQYDPKLPNYVSLETLVHGSDVEFCRNVAKTSIDVFNAFLKAQ